MLIPHPVIEPDFPHRLTAARRRQSASEWRLALAALVHPVQALDAIQVVALPLLNKNLIIHVMTQNESRWLVRDLLPYVQAHDEACQYENKTPPSLDAPTRQCKGDFVVQ